MTSRHRANKPRQLHVRSVRREPPDLELLAHALVELAIDQTSSNNHDSAITENQQPKPRTADRP